MMDSPRIQATADKPRSRRAGLALPTTRYRHPGDVIRLIVAALVLAVAGTITALAPSDLLNPGAATISAVAASTTPGRVLTGLVQVTMAGAALVLLVAGLRRRRFRVLATVAGGFVLAAALMTAILYLTGQDPLAAPAGLRQGSWLTGAGFPNPAVIAGLAAVAESAAPWLSRPWRRTAWATLLLVAVARLITGGLSPLELVLAVAAGVTVGPACSSRSGCPTAGWARRAWPQPSGRAAYPPARWRSRG